MKRGRGKVHEWAEATKDAALNWMEQSTKVAKMVLAGESDPMSGTFQIEDTRLSKLHGDLCVHLNCDKLIEVCDFILALKPTPAPKPKRGRKA